MKSFFLEHLVRRFYMKSNKIWSLLQKFDGFFISIPDFGRPISKRHSANSFPLYRGVAGLHGSHCSLPSFRIISSVSAVFSTQSSTFLRLLLSMALWSSSRFLSDSRILLGPSYDSPNNSCSPVASVFSSLPVLSQTQQLLFGPELPFFWWWGTL